MVKIGFVTVSDRASRGEYEDQSGPAMEAWLKSAVVTPYETVRRVIPDGMESVRDTLIDLCDNEACDLLLTTGRARVMKRRRPCRPSCTRNCRVLAN